MTVPKGSLSRLETMSEEDSKWDLSPNDRAAIVAVLLYVSFLERAVDAAEAYFWTPAYVNDKPINRANVELAESEYHAAMLALGRTEGPR